MNEIKTGADAMTTNLTQLQQLHSQLAKQFNELAKNISLLEDVINKEKDIINADDLLIYPGHGERIATMIFKEMCKLGISHNANPTFISSKAIIKIIGTMELFKNVTNKRQLPTIFDRNSDLLAFSLFSRVMTYPTNGEYRCRGVMWKKSFINQEKTRYLLTVKDDELIMIYLQGDA